MGNVVHATNVTWKESSFLVVPREITRVKMKLYLSSTIFWLVLWAHNFRIGIPTVETQAYSAYNSVHYTTKPPYSGCIAIKEVTVKGMYLHFSYEHKVIMHATVMLFCHFIVLNTCAKQWILILSEQGYISLTTAFCYIVMNVSTQSLRCYDYSMIVVTIVRRRHINFFEVYCNYSTVMLPFSDAYHNYLRM